MTLHPGDPATVTFHGALHRAVVLKPAGHGWWLCRIRQDPSDDYHGIEPPDNTLKSTDIDFVALIRETDIRRGDE